MDVESAETDAVEQEVYLAKFLEVSRVELRGALERLARLGLVIPTNDGYRKRAENLATHSEIPSQSIRAAHRKLLAKATMALDLQPVGKRAFNSLVLAIDVKRLEEAKVALSQFCRKFNDEFGGPGPKQAVYCLSTLFFALSKELP